MKLRSYNSNDNLLIPYELSAFILEVYSFFQCVKGDYHIPYRGNTRVLRYNEKTEKFTDITKRKRKDIFEDERFLLHLYSCKVKADQVLSVEFDTNGITNDMYVSLGMHVRNELVADGNPSPTTVAIVHRGEKVEIIAVDKPSTAVTASKFQKLSPNAQYAAIAACLSVIPISGWSIQLLNRVRGLCIHKLNMINGSQSQKHTGKPDH